MKRTASGSAIGGVPTATAKTNRARRRVSASVPPDSRNRRSGPSTAASLTDSRGNSLALGDLAGLEQPARERVAHEGEHVLADRWPVASGELGELRRRIGDRVRGVE